MGCTRKSGSEARTLPEKFSRNPGRMPEASIMNHGDLIKPGELRGSALLHVSLQYDRLPFTLPQKGSASSRFKSMRTSEDSGLVDQKSGVGPWHHRRHRRHFRPDSSSLRWQRLTNRDSNARELGRFASALAMHIQLEHRAIATMIIESCSRTWHSLMFGLFLPV